MDCASIKTDRRESASSRSTSAIITTPINTTPALHYSHDFDQSSSTHSSPTKGYLHQLQGLAKEAGFEKMARAVPAATLEGPRDMPQGIRRVRSFERTRSWAETVQQHHGEFTAEPDSETKDDYGLLKPPSTSSSGRDRRSSWSSTDDRDKRVGREEPVDAAQSITSWSSRKASDKIDRQYRKASNAQSASTVSSFTPTESDEELASMSSAELGRRIMAREREERILRIKQDEPPDRKRPDALLLHPHHVASMGPRSAQTTSHLSPTTTPKTPTPPKLPKQDITSIDDIVKRHSEAMIKPQHEAKEKARKELGMATAPRPDKGGPVTPRQRRKDQSPTIPSRTSSSPLAVVGVIPPRTSSRTDLTSFSPSRISLDSHSTGTGSDSVLRSAMLNQAVLERLESGSPPSSPSLRRVSFQTDRETPTRPKVERSMTTPFRSPKNRGTPSIKEEEEEQHTQAVAAYLRSPNLNRYFTFPRPYPESGFRVSVAEVGSATGAPVLLFLGLGCVRHLIALFDELAKALDLRLVCIDRWGYGKTDMIDEEKRGLREWAAVVERVLDEMKISQFSVLAHSAGCPYALAAANRMQDRVTGRIHLLAPWVGTDVDNSYKWLKWVPNGVIKSATAAEWKLQSYFLGKPPPLVLKPVGYTFTPPASTTHLPLGSSRNASRLSLGPGSPALGRKPSLLHRASSIMLRSKSAEPDTPDSGRTAMAKPNGNLAVPSLGSSVPLHKQAAPSPRALDFGLSEGFDTFTADLKPPPSASSSQPRRSLISSYSYSYSYSRTPPAKPKASRSAQAGSPAPPSGPSFGVALQQASHAECEPGTTSDLLSIVLNREHANRPWQYALNYADFSLPVKIYWGADDDKISEKSVRWLEKTIKAGVELRVLPGEGHNLMTSTNTMLDVFQSLAAEIASARKDSVSAFLDAELSRL